MSRSAAFLLSLSACLLMSMSIKIGPPLIETVRIVGETLGGAVALMGLSWALAGLIYLLSSRNMAAGPLAVVAIVVAGVVASFAFVGQQPLP